MEFNLKKYAGTLGGMLASFAVVSVILLILIIVYFYIYLPNFTNHGETVTVPNVEGMQLEELEEFLGKRSLRYEVSDSSFSDDKPPLAILKQYPAPNSKVKEGRVIYISVNRITPPTVPFPDFEGRQSLVNVEAVLKANEFKRGEIELVNGPFLNFVEELRYNGRKIEAGERIPKGSVIDIVVQDGGKGIFDAPDVMGYTMEICQTTIFGSSLNMAEPVVVGDTTGGEPIVVLKQKPVAGEKVRAGDVIQLWIGKRGTPVPEDEEEDEPIENELNEES